MKHSNQTKKPFKSPFCKKTTEKTAVNELKPSTKPSKTTLKSSETNEDFLRKQNLIELRSKQGDDIKLNNLIEKWKIAGQEALNLLRDLIGETVENKSQDVGWDSEQGMELWNTLGNCLNSTGKTRENQSKKLLKITNSSGFSNQPKKLTLEGLARKLGICIELFGDYNEDDDMYC